MAVDPKKLKELDEEYKKLEEIIAEMQTLMETKQAGLGTHSLTQLTWRFLFLYSTPHYGMISHGSVFCFASTTLMAIPEEIDNNI